MSNPTAWQTDTESGIHIRPSLFPSHKNQRRIECQSALQADYCVHLEYDPSVVSYEAQPDRFDVAIGGRVSSYQPDFLVQTHQGAYYTEVEVDFTQLARRRTSKLWAAQALLAGCDSGLFFADERSIRPRGRLHNLKFLYWHSFNVSEQEMSACLRVLPTLRYPIRLRALLLQTTRVRERAIYRAMFTRHLRMELSERLTLDTYLDKATPCPPTPGLAGNATRAVE